MNIAFVIPYFGKFPPWFPAFMLSCAHNPNIHWLIFCDADNIPSHKPDNIFFHILSFDDFKQTASQIIQVPLNFQNPHKLCDFKPLYGKIFEKHLENYSYWGHCDLDIIWGDIELFLTQNDYTTYDIISTRKQAISGHFTLYKNNSKINTLFRKVKNYKKIYLIENFQGFDEGFFSYMLYLDYIEKKTDLKIFWHRKYAVDWPELKYRPFGWHWQNGKILDKNGTERIYLHFMKWKKDLQQMDFSFEDNPSAFKIDRFGIWTDEVPTRFNIQSYLASRPFYRSVRYLVRDLLGVPQKEIGYLDEYKFIE